MILKRTKIRAFSLVEVLLSVLIISMVLLLAIPVVTKKTDSFDQKFRGGSAAFYFNNQNGGNFPCYVTTLDSTGKTIVKDTSGKCETHEFVVPSGVHRIDLTLVAGGGGGGGAAGGYVYTQKVYSYGSTTTAEVPLDLFKSINIDVLTGAGASGGASSTSGADYTAGQGGASGYAIVNHQITKDTIYEKLGYSPSWLLSANKANIEYLSGFTKPLLTSGSPPENFGGAGISIQTPYLTNNYDYAIFAQDSSGSDGIVCYTSHFPISGTIIKYFDTVGKGIENCGISGSSYIARKAGENGASIAASNSINTYVANTLEGGEGGKITTSSSIKGAGGKGESIILRCKNTSNTTCAASTADSSTKIGAETIATGFDKRNRYGETTVSVEHPGGTGSGGSGGTALKINNFPVKPGAKYTIVVGSGGSGGSSGNQGTIHEETVLVKATEGSNGIGGSSTAIFDEDGNLVLMVTGGIGGFGGSVNDGAETKGITDASYPSLPSPARNVPLAILPQSGSIDASNLDTNVTASVSNTLAGQSVDIPSGYTAKYVKYAYINDVKSPLYELNTNDTKITSNATLSTLTYDDLVGGFTKFNNTETAADKVSLQTTDTYGGQKNPKLYNGFYFRNSNGDNLIYAGGMGGFSGLGTKAGCGGLFVGNKDGILSDGTASSALKNTFTTGTKNGGKIYSINEYYDNCSAVNPNGGSAKFIPPLSIAGVAENLGQAGAGGGGGGWSQSLGAGKGGDGQNGYVLIQWQTK